MFAILFHRQTGIEGLNQCKLLRLEGTRPEVHILGTSKLYCPRIRTTDILQCSMVCDSGAALHLILLRLINRQIFDLDRRACLFLIFMLIHWFILLFSKD
jgi:hypothetical protein